MASGRECNWAKIAYQEKWCKDMKNDTNGSVRYRDQACTQRYCCARHSFSDGGADTEFQKVGDEELAKGRIIKSPGVMPGFLVHSHPSPCTASFMPGGNKAGLQVVDKHERDRV